MKKAVFLGMILICVISFNACTKVEENKDIMPPLSSSETAEYAESEESETESIEPEEILSEQKQWKVNICSDMPEPYIEVLQQYEQFMNADNRNINDESVRSKFEGGEWKDLYDELCMSWSEFTENAYHYALTDLTGDGFPEMIIAYKDIPEVIYNYSETKGIGMECASSYFHMTIYDNGILEYVSGGTYSSTTYLQFQEDVEEWVVLDRIASKDTWDFGKWINEAYYTGDWDGSGQLTDTISEKEYLQIQEKYVTEPMQFEWIPLVDSKTDVWFSYEKNDDFVYEHDFMASRDGQGYHWWIYLEAAYIMRDYGKKVGYDFTLDHWTVERIYPIGDGYYNIVLSQNNHDVAMDLLCHPNEGKYVVLYAQYEDGNRTGGVNQIPYASQLEWHDFDFNESYGAQSVENPFGEICETSVSSVLYIALYQYGQNTGYNGEWHVRELFGRSPFFDYLVESENGFVWFCVDIGQDFYTYVTFE